MNPSRAPASQLREDLARAAQKADLAERTLDADAVVAEIELQSGRVAPFARDIRGCSRGTLDIRS
jgi:hypothetical protein